MKVKVKIGIFKFSSWPKSRQNLTMSDTIQYIFKMAGILKVETKIKDTCNGVLKDFVVKLLKQREQVPNSSIFCYFRIMTSWNPFIFRI